MTRKKVFFSAGVGLLVALGCSHPFGGTGKAEKANVAHGEREGKKKPKKGVTDPKDKVRIAPPVPPSGVPPRTSDIPPMTADILQFGTAEIDRLGDVVVAGNAIYVAGTTGGALAGPHAGRADSWVRKYSKNGRNLLWETQFGSDQDDEIRALAVDGDLLVATGQTEGALTKGGPAVHEGDCFLVGYGPAGEELFREQFGSKNMDECIGLAIRGDAIIVSGGSLGTLDQPKHGREDVIVRRYDRGGRLVWGKQLGTPQFEEALGLAIGASGVYLAGMTDGKWEKNLGGTDLLVVKLDFDGNVVWARQLGTSGMDCVRTIAVDETAVYIAGHTAGKMGRQAFGDGDVVTARLNEANGDIVWVDQFGTDLADSAGAIELRGNEVWVLGSVLSPGKHEAGMGSIETVLRRLDRDGRELYTGRLGSVSDDRGLGLAVDGQHVWMVGETSGHFAGQNHGMWDAWLGIARTADLR